MNKLISFGIVLLLSAQVSHSQWINNIFTDPANPTEADPVKVIVHTSFPYGGCAEWSIVNQYQNGNEFTYYDLHCIGMAAFICYNYDTINMGLLPSGSYSVIINLNAGYGNYPCTQAFQWAVDSLHFDVIPLTGIKAFPYQNLTLKPNPVTDGNISIVLPEGFNTSGQCVLSITDINGRELQRISLQGADSEIDIPTGLSRGIYLLSITGTKQYLKPFRFIVL